MIWYPVGVSVWNAYKSLLAEALYEFIVFGSVVSTNVFIPPKSFVPPCVNLNFIS